MNLHTAQDTSIAERTGLAYAKEELVAEIFRIFSLCSDEAAG